MDCYPSSRKARPLWNDFDEGEDADDNDDVRPPDLMPVAGHGSSKKSLKHRLVHRSGPHLVDGNNGGRRRPQGMKHRLVHTSGPHLVNGGGVDQKTIERFMDQAFDAYNLRHNKFHGHRFRPQIYGPEPIMEDGKMWFRSKFKGRIPVTGETQSAVVWTNRTTRMHFTVPVRMTNDELEGKDPRRVDTETVQIFQVSYTVAYPAGRKPKEEGEKPNVRDLPHILLLHGVPMNRRLKYEIMKQLGKHALVLAPDMHGMGESDMPHDYGKAGFPYRVPPETEEDRDNFNRAWDWKYDTDYIHLLMKGHLPREYNLDINKKWVFQADDWGARKKNPLLYSFFLSLDLFFFCSADTSDDQERASSSATFATSSIARMSP